MVQKQTLCIKPESYTGMYAMHKYWSKKPYNIINKYIETYSKLGDIVLDPFTGSGIGNIESVLLNRKTMGIDINPMSIFITRQVLDNIDTHAIEQVFFDLMQKLQKKIEKLYIINQQKEKFVGTHFIYNGDKLTEIWYKDKEGTKNIIRPTDNHIKMAHKIKYDDIKTFYPKNKMLDNSRINTKNNIRICDLFTPRNTMALSLILNEINKIKNTRLRNFFKFCFTGCLGQASKMVFVVNNRNKMNGNKKTSNRKEVGSWVIGYWLPKEHFEINAWNCFTNRYKRILKSKKQYEKNNVHVKYVRNFQQLKNNEGNVLLINNSCYPTLKKMPNNSIDYVITDPPHGDRIPYLELSMMWNNWLEFKPNMEKELIVSDAKKRDKTPEVYNALLKNILIEINRVLKFGKYFTLMFNSYDDEAWINLQHVLFDLDFELIDVNTIGYSAASVVQDCRKGGLKTDFILTFKKTNVKHEHPSKFATNNLICKLLEEYVKNNKEDSTYRILNYVIVRLMNRKLLFTPSSIIYAMSDNHLN